VYILRATGQVAMGPAVAPVGEQVPLTDARWNERLAALVLIAGIVAIGVAPGWLADLIYPGAELTVKAAALQP
jgi:NADH-quinone oxidoreductase subunit M